MDNNAQWLAFHGHPGYTEAFATRVRHYFDQGNRDVWTCIDLVIQERQT